MRDTIPVVEITRDSDPSRIGRPNGEGDPTYGTLRGWVNAGVCAEHFPEFLMTTLVD